MQHLQAAQGHIVGAAQCPFRDVGHYHTCEYLLLVQTRVRVRKMTTTVILTHNLWQSARGLPPRNQLRSLTSSGHPLEAKRCAAVSYLSVSTLSLPQSRAIGILILQTAVSHVSAPAMTHDAGHNWLGRFQKHVNHARLEQEQKAQRFQTHAQSESTSPPLAGCGVH